MKLEIKLNLTPAQIAEAFAELDDEKQAQVFIEVARIAATWEGTTFDQWFAVGKHLRDCECSSDEARDLVRRIAEGSLADPVHLLGAS